MIRTNPDQTIILNQLIKDLRSSWDINKESFGDMLQAEYVFFIEHDFNRAISIYKDTLRKNPLYPVFISLHEICSIYQKRCGINMKHKNTLIKTLKLSFEWEDIRYIVVKRKQDIKTISELLQNLAPDIHPQIFTTQQILEDVIGCNHNRQLSISDAK